MKVCYVKYIANDDRKYMDFQTIDELGVKTLHRIKKREIANNSEVLSFMLSHAPVVHKDVCIYR